MNASDDNGARGVGAADTYMYRVDDHVYVYVPTTRGNHLSMCYNI
jgi:hypothetical protein